MTARDTSEALAERPIRVQLSRAKGWRKPVGCVVVSRPTKWGNPFDWREAQDEWGGTRDEAQAAVVSIYRDWLTFVEADRFGAHLRGARVAIIAGMPALRGKDLACWCRPGTPCHADVLLEIANAPPSQEGSDG